MRTRIYIAGPIVLGDLEANIRQAAAAGIALLKAGYAPLCPHLSCYYGGNTPEVLPCGTRVEDWYTADHAWVAVSDALLRLPGEGKGSDAEVALARKLSIPVYHDMKQLLREMPAERPGDDRFLALLGAIGRLPSAHVLFEEAAALVADGVVEG